VEVFEVFWPVGYSVVLPGRSGEDMTSFASRWFFEERPQRLGKNTYLGGYVDIVVVFHGEGESFVCRY
jgi:hypothetical protein